MCFDLSDDEMPEMITGIGELISPIDPDKDELLVPSPRVREFMQQVVLNALPISAPHSPSTLLVGS